MQLDALRTEFHAIEVENRRLREENPEGAEAQDLERELREAQEENVRLAQQLSEAGPSDGRSGETSQAELDQLREEVRELQQRLNEASTRLAEAEDAGGRAQRRAEQAEEYMRTLENAREQARDEAELKCLRAVAEETKKWDQREAGMLQTIEELAYSLRGTTVGGGLGVGGVGAGRGPDGAKEQEEREAPLHSPSVTEPAIAGGPAATRATSSERYVLADNTCGGPDVGGGPGKEVLNTHKRDKPVNRGDKGGSKSLAAGTRGSTSLDARTPQFTPLGGAISSPSRTSSSTCTSSVRFSTGATPLAAATLGPRDTTYRTDIRHGHGDAVAPVPTLAAAPLDALSMTLLAQQLPPIPNFTGDHMDGDGETFEEWLERLELVAATCHWDDRTKLVNIATRLRGSASRFYRTCSPQQRSDYTALTTALTQRFIPVRIQAVQSSRFHERRQEAKETVDSYAQELRKLFYQAYSSASGTEGADRMGQSVLSYQFIAGLVSDLKRKLVGREGTFEQLPEVARFEEARIRDIGHLGGLRPRPPTTPSMRNPTETSSGRAER